MATDNLDLLMANRSAVLAILERQGLRRPVVFGSTARRTDHEDSDIDLLVEPDPDVGLFSLARAMLDLEALLHRRVDILTPGSLPPSMTQRVARESRPL